MKELIRGSKTISITYKKEGISLNDSAFLRYDEMIEGGCRFSYGTIFNGINGIKFIEDEISCIKKYKEYIDKEIYDFFSRDDLIIELYNGHYYIEQSCSVEKEAVEMFFDAKEIFIRENKKFFVEIYRKSELEGLYIIKYKLSSSCEIEEIEEIREYKKGDKLKENEIIIKRAFVVDDIDYGLMTKMIDFVCVKRKKLVNR